MYQRAIYMINSNTPKLTHAHLYSKIFSWGDTPDPNWKQNYKIKVQA